MNLGGGINLDADGNVAGAPPWVATGRPYDRPIKTYAADRTCASPRCTARLSIYNDANVCASCSGERWADH